MGLGLIQLKLIHCFVDFHFRVCRLQSLEVNSGPCLSTRSAEAKRVQPVQILDPRAGFSGFSPSSDASWIILDEFQLSKLNNK